MLLIYLAIVAIIVVVLTILNFSPSKQMLEDGWNHVDVILAIAFCWPIILTFILLLAVVMCILFLVGFIENKIINVINRR